MVRGILFNPGKDTPADPDALRKLIDAYHFGGLRSLRRFTTLCENASNSEPKKSAKGSQKLYQASLPGKVPGNFDIMTGGVDGNNPGKARRGVK